MLLPWLVAGVFQHDRFHPDVGQWLYDPCRSLRRTCSFLESGHNISDPSRGHGRRVVVAVGQTWRRASDRTGDGSEVRFFAEHELPTDLSTSRVLLAQIRRMFEHRRRPDLPTEFSRPICHLP